MVEKEEIKNPYFGQTPPGDTAEIFAKDVISIKGRYEYGISFSPKGDEIIFGATEDERTAIFHSKNIDGTWTAPQKVSLSQGAFSEEMEAFFSPDGKHIYFAPYNEGMDVRIWGVDITEDGWRNPRKLNDLINSGPVFYPVCSANNNLYFTNIKKKKICKAIYKDGKYNRVEELDFPFGGHFYIAPDESFALIDGRGADTLGKGDIHVIFKDEDGNWQEPVNLGPQVNSEFSETCPSLTYDGKYIFFARYNDVNGTSNFYWVDAKILDELR
jgi:Tol biopolymer transport system component